MQKSCFRVIDFGALKVKYFPGAVQVIPSLQFAGEAERFNSKGGAAESKSKVFSIFAFAKKSVNLIESLHYG